VAPHVPILYSLETARVFAIKSRDTHALIFCSKVARARTSPDYSVVIVHNTF